MTSTQRSSEVTPRKVRWLWKDRFPQGMISVVAGKPDQGKGLLAARIAADVSRRGERVLYSAIEDAADYMTRPRLEAAGANLDNVHLPEPFVFPADLDDFHSVVADVKPRLVVIDPFAAHLSGVSQYADSIRKVLTPLDAIIREADAGCLITAHALKNVAKNAHPLSAIGGGSSGLPAACRMGFVFGGDPGDSDRYVLCCVKSNLREKPKPLDFELDVDEFPVVGDMPSLVAKGECKFNPMELLIRGDSATRGPQPTRRAEAAEWLTNYLVAAGQPMLGSAIVEDAKQHGISAKTLRRAADDMGVVKSPPSGPNVKWDLPPEVRRLMGQGP